MNKQASKWASSDELTMCVLVLLCLLLCVSLSHTQIRVPIPIRQYGSTQANRAPSKGPGGHESLPSASECHLEYAGRTRRHRILLFLDSAFFSLFQNWMAYYTDSCGNSTQALHRLELVCMDEHVESMLADLRPLQLACSAHSSILYQQKQKIRNKASLVWIKRLEIINQILSKGVDLILSDTDAFWLRSPYPDLIAHLTRRTSQGTSPGTSQSTSSIPDIIASRGWFPFSLSKHWGSTLCMGFIFIRSTAFSLRLFEQVLANMLDKQLQMEAYQHYLVTNVTHYQDSESGRSIALNLTWWGEQDNQEPDDQYSANRWLYDHQIRWPVMNTTYRTDAHIGRLWTNGTEHQIVLLSEDAYVRNCANNALKRIGKMRFPTATAYRAIRARVMNATIAHCLIAPGQSRKKENYLVFYSLWRLPYNASEVAQFIRNDLKAKGKKTPTKPVMARHDNASLAALRKAIIKLNHRNRAQNAAHSAAYAADNASMSIAQYVQAAQDADKAERKRIKRELLEKYRLLRAKGVSGKKKA